MVEAGANFGAHTVAMAQMIGPTGYIFAFEPQRLVFQAMVANIAINSLDNVTTVQAALGSHAGVARIPILNPNKGLNFGSFSIGMFDIGESVPIQTIDSLDLNQCRLIKVDVEGMEYEVLEGARKTIERLRPLLYVENDRGEKSQQLISQIQSFGYRLWWHLPDLFNPNNLHQDSENIYKDLISVNMLCAPQNSEFAFDLPEILTSSDDWRKTCSNI